MGWGWECGEEREGGITREHRETFGVDRCDQYLDCGDGFTNVYETYLVVFFRSIVSYMSAIPQ